MAYDTEKQRGTPPEILEVMSLEALEVEDVHYSTIIKQFRVNAFKQR